MKNQGQISTQTQWFSEWHFASIKFSVEKHARAVRQSFWLIQWSRSWIPEPPQPVGLTRVSSKYTGSSGRGGVQPGSAWVTGYSGLSGSSTLSSFLPCPFLGQSRTGALCQSHMFLQTGKHFLPRTTSRWIIMLKVNFTN